MEVTWLEWRAEENNEYGLHRGLNARVCHGGWVGSGRL